MKAYPSLRIDQPNLSESAKVKLRHQLLRDNGADLPDLFRIDHLPETVGQKNCENWIGSVSLPVGVAGPITLHYQKSTSTHYLPLATTEGALVASVSRGSKAITAAGGAQVLVKKMGMTRAPVFVCSDGAQAGEVLTWLDEERDLVRKTGESTSQHLKYLSHQGWVRGKHLYVRFAFDPDQAMGMNMVSLAVTAIAQLIEERFPQVKLVALTSNVCSDKKDNFINSLLGRGYWAQAEVVLSRSVVESVLKTAPAKFFQTHLQKNLVGSNLAGSLSQNAQAANVLAALYLATGQDPAHVVEGSKAFLSVSLEGQDLFVSLTLPNLNLGTVGGGTYLPAQSQARQLIGDSLRADQLAAVTAAACLAGELSLLASLSEQSLAEAHRRLAR